jgi:hypothetical protein
MVSIIETAMSETKEVVLVSKEGRKFSVSQEVAKQSSPYFEAVLENQMLEAGK